MCNCSCGSEEKKNALLPQVGIITDIRRETPDVKTFRIVRPDGTKLFEHMPGQCAMLCVPGVGEALFSITSSPTNKEYQEFSIKECGTLTNYLHNMSVGDEILVRGPYGNHFPVETVLKGQDLLFIAGGIGLAPLRSVINYVLDNRDNYGTVDIVYGSRSKDDLVQLKEIQEVWAKAKDVNVHLTIDREQEGFFILKSLYISVHDPCHSVSQANILLGIFYSVYRHAYFLVHFSHESHAKIKLIHLSVDCKFHIVFLLYYSKRGRFLALNTFTLLFLSYL